MFIKTYLPVYQEPNMTRHPNLLVNIAKMHLVIMNVKLSITIGTINYQSKPMLLVEAPEEMLEMGETEESQAFSQFLVNLD